MRCEQLVGLAALLEVVERAELDRLLGRLPARVGGEQDHVGLGAVRLGRPQHVEAVAVGHPQIRHDHVEGLVGQRLDGRGDARRPR